MSVHHWPDQTLYEVADGITTIVHGQGEVGVANSTIIVEDKRAFVVDTMTFPEMASGIAHEVKRRSAHVQTVINTHHHIDHTGGNTVFAAEAQLIAHPGTIAMLQKLGLPANIYDNLMPQFRGHFSQLELVIPEAFPEALTLPFDGELRVFTPAHTAADTTLWFPQSRVLIAGDIGFIGVTPLAVNGLLSGWIEALDALIALQPDVVIPGHGSIGTLQDLLLLRTYLLQVFSLGNYAVANQLETRDALELFDATPFAHWLEPKRTAINLERAMQEARGEISRQDLSAMPKRALQDQGK